MATKKVKKVKKEVKKQTAAVITQDQLINLAAMIAEGTVFLLHNKGLSDDERYILNSWSQADATAEIKSFVNQQGVTFLLGIINNLTGEKFGPQITQFDKFTGNAITSTGQSKATT